MKNLLQKISEKAIQLKDIEFNQLQLKSRWLGAHPATNNELLQTEQRLGLKLPDDYKTFLSITNGFSAPNDIEPAFEPISNIDYLKNLDKETISTYNINGLEHFSTQLKKSILIGGIDQEQYFLLIPPSSATEQWKYWKFAHWLIEEEEYLNLESYFESVLNFLKTV